MTEAQETQGKPLFLRRQDRVGKFLHGYLERFVFDEFAKEYLQREGLAGILTGVPVPMTPQDVVEFHRGEGIKVLNIARAMAWIIGADPEFAHRESYLAYIRRYFNDKFPAALVNEGRELTEAGKPEEGIILFRAALLLAPDYLPAMMSYAIGCRNLYQLKEGEEPDYVGCFKAESMEYLELITIVYPQFKDSYYYLGYAYLNLGLYTKATLIWRQYLKLASEPGVESTAEVTEIEERLQQLADPVEIEKGINHISAGRYNEGIEVLVPYLKTQYEKWWPLPYYLGIGYSRLGQGEAAKDQLLKAFALSPSNRDIMEELVLIYEAEGDLVKAEKYRKKMNIVTQ